jgi:hypothetical protein
MRQLLATLVLTANLASSQQSSVHGAVDAADGGWFTSFSPGEHEESPSFGAVPVVGRIRRMVWNHSDDSFSKRMMQRPWPVVLEGSPVASWPAVRKWTTAERVADAVGRDTVVYATHSRDGSFLFHSVTKAKTADPSYSPPNQ